MIEHKKMTYKEMDDEFLLKLLLLAKTYEGTNDDVKNFVDFAFMLGKQQQPTDIDYITFPSDAG